MTSIPAGSRAFLATCPFAHIVTLDPDGTPQVSIGWAGLEGDDIVWACFSEQRKLANLRRDPRITLSFVAPESGGELLHPYLVIRGRATVVEGGALATMDHLARTYLGEGVPFPIRNVPPGFTIRVDVERVYGVGAWRERAPGEGDG